mmetsp:Transcript_32886/g.74574  ORF Transcript_32886/g.74574 Transcript_32886/m.74574 type:complete len:369 (+) Transcript_32886:498-1604(+)
MHLNNWLTRKKLSARNGASRTTVAFIILTMESACLDWFTRSAVSRIEATSFSTLLGSCSGAFPRSRNMLPIWVMFACPYIKSRMKSVPKKKSNLDAGTIGARSNACSVKPVLFMILMMSVNMMLSEDFGLTSDAIRLSISSLILLEERSRTSRRVSAPHSMTSSKTSWEDRPVPSRICVSLSLKPFLVAGSLSFSSTVCSILGRPRRNVRCIMSATPKNDFITTFWLMGSSSSSGLKPANPNGSYSQSGSSRSPSPRTLRRIAEASCGPACALLRCLMAWATLPNVSSTGLPVEEPPSFFRVAIGNDGFLIIEPCIAFMAAWPSMSTIALPVFMPAACPLSGAPCFARVRVAAAFKRGPSTSAGCLPA